MNSKVISQRNFGNHCCRSDVWRFCTNNSFKTFLISFNYKFVTKMGNIWTRPKPQLWQRTLEYKWIVTAYVRITFFWKRRYGMLSLTTTTLIPEPKGICLHHKRLLKIQNSQHYCRCQGALQLMKCNNDRINPIKWVLF